MKPLLLIFGLFFSELYANEKELKIDILASQFHTKTKPLLLKDKSYTILSIKPPNDKFYRLKVITPDATKYKTRIVYPNIQIEKS